MPLHEDDRNIADDAILWRRVPNRPKYYKEADDGTLIPSSANFLDDEKELSVNLSELTTIEKVLTGHDGFGLISIEAGIPRRNSQIVVSDPIEDAEDVSKNDPSHCLICPKPIPQPGDTGRKTAARNMARASKWVRQPEII